MRGNLILYLQFLPLLVNSQKEIFGKFDILSEKNGLPTRSITSLVQDENGFIWVGTTEGLIRYDGYSFVSFRSSTGNKPSSTNNIITAIVRNSMGILWIGHGNGMVTRFDPSLGPIASYQVYEQSKGEPIRALYVDKFNDLWVSVDRVGLFKFQPAANNFIFKGTPPMTEQDAGYSENRYKTIGSFEADSNNNLWLTTVSGLTYYNQVEETFTKVISGPSLGQMLSDSIGNLWITSWGGGLNYYEIKSKKLTKFLWEKETSSLTTNISSHLLWKNKNEFWITTFRGFGVFNIQTRKFRFYPSELDDGPGLVTGYLINSSDGKIWLTSEKGLIKMDDDHKLFAFNKLGNSNSNFNTSFIFSDTIDGTTYGGTWQGDGLHIIKNGNEHIVKVVENDFPETSGGLNDLCKDRNGNIWILTENKIYQYDRSVRSLVELPQPVINDNMAAPIFIRIIEAADGIMWITSYRKGLFSYDPKKKIYKQYTTNATGNSVCSNELWDIIEDSKKRIWVASPRKGISVYDPALNYFTSFNSENSIIAGNGANSFAKAKNGDIWLSSNAGLIQCSIESGFLFKNWTIENGLPSNNIGSIDIDGEGNIWGLTSSNILFAARIEDKDKLSVQSFDYSDGLDLKLFGIKNDGAGNLCISSSGGYYIFNPKEVLKPKESAPSIVLTSLLVNNQKVLPEKGADNGNFLSLDHNQNFISFEFAVLNFRPPTKNLYSYYLENADITWSPPSTERSVRYSALRPGEYTFRVRLVGSAYDNGPEYSMRILIKKPFWKTSWFTLSGAVIIASGLFFIHRIRLNQVRRQHSQQAEFQQKIAEAEMHALRLQMNPHFIFNSLNSINRFILKSDVEQATHYLTKFSKLIRLILDNSKNKSIQLDQELATIKLYIELESVRFNGKFNYSIQLDDDMDPEKILIPPMLIQPYIENAIWHGLLHKNTVGSIQVYFQKQNDQLVCTIQDDGIGRQMAQQLESKSAVIEKSYGMKITKDRLNYNNQNKDNSSVEVIDLISNDGNPVGTKVIIKIRITEVDLN